MQILLGDASSHKSLKIMQEYNIGRLFVQQIRKPYPGEPWAFDNGAYHLHLKGLEIGNYSQDSPIVGDFLVRLNKALKISQEYWPPYLAVLPDVVAGGRQVT